MTAETRTPLVTPTQLVTPARLVRSELLKLTTLRSTWVVLVALPVLVAGIGAVAAATARTGAPGTAGHAAALDLVLGGSAVGLLLAAALGAVAGAREAASGMLGTTFAAVPGRAGVVVAKAAALAVLLAPASLLAAAGAFAAGAATLDARGLAAPALRDPGAVRVVLGTAAYLVAVALVGLGVGLLVRSTAGAVATVLGVVLVIPSIAEAVLPHRWSHVLHWLPADAGDALTASTRVPGTLAPAAAGAALLGWVLVVTALAALRVTRRDA